MVPVVVPPQVPNFVLPLVELDEVLVSSSLQAGILCGIELLFWRLILHVKS